LKEFPAAVNLGVRFAVHSDIGLVVGPWSLVVGKRIFADVRMAEDWRLMTDD
jgi:hypothetical protein